MAKPRHRIKDEVMYDGMVFTNSRVDLLPDIMKLKTTPDDIFIATYPKSGTIWISEILSMLEHEGIFDTMYSKTDLERFVNLEFRIPQPDGKPDCVGVEEAVKREGTRRLIRTHLRYKWIKKNIEEHGSKLVVVIRNLRDVLVSFYHFYCNIPGLGNFAGSWEEYFEMFKDKHLFYGDWLDHVREYYALRHNTNVHVVFYEDAVDDLKTTVEELAKFMGKSLPEDVMNTIVENARFSNMEKNKDKIFSESREAVRRIFFRKGTYGSWIEHFTPEQDEYVKVNYDQELEKMGLRLKF